MKGCKLAKKVPVIGAFASVLMWPADIAAKGLVIGTLNSLADATPGLGTAKGIAELGTGDLIPDSGQTGPSGLDRLVQSVDSLNRHLAGDAAVDKHQQDFRNGLHEVQRAVEYIPRQMFGDGAVNSYQNSYQNNFQNGLRTVTSWFR